MIRIHAYPHPQDWIIRTTINRLSSEHEILREEVRSLQEVRAKLQGRVQELEEELKALKEQEKGKKEKEEEEEEVPMAQRKRFTR